MGMVVGLVVPSLVVVLFGMRARRRAEHPAHALTKLAVGLGATGLVLDSAAPGASAWGFVVAATECGLLAQALPQVFGPDDGPGDDGDEPAPPDGPSDPAAWAEFEQAFRAHASQDTLARR